MPRGDATPERRHSDRLLQEMGQQLHDRLSALAERVRRVEEDHRMLERDGSRGLAVLTERVRGFEVSVQDKARDADRIHEDLKRMFSQAMEYAAELESRIKKLEEVEGGRVGFQQGILKLIGPYAGFLFGALGLLYAFFNQ